VEAWEKIVARPGEADTLREVQKAVELITPSSHFVMCQRGVQWFGLLETGGLHQTAFWESVALGIPVFDDGRVGFPEESLSLIFFQAKTLKPLLEAKIAELSVQCNGLLSIQEDPSNPKSPVRFVPASQALSDPELTHRIKWAPLKKIDRVKQKLHRCYKSDVSRLCDLCRETMVFSCAADLLACFKLLIDDSEIAVTRTKSSMDPDGEPQHLSGFRQISLNFKILSESSCKKGVSWHGKHLGSKQTANPDNTISSTCLRSHEPRTAGLMVRPCSATMIFQGPSLTPACDRC